MNPDYPFSIPRNQTSIEVFIDKMKALKQAYGDYKVSSHYFENKRAEILSQSYLGSLDEVREAHEINKALFENMLAQVEIKDLRAAKTMNLLEEKEAEKFAVLKTINEKSASKNKDADFGKEF